MFLTSLFVKLIVSTGGGSASASTSWNGWSRAIDDSWSTPILEIVDSPVSVGSGSSDREFLPRRFGSAVSKGVAKHSGIYIGSGQHAMSTQDGSSYYSSCKFTKCCEDLSVVSVLS